MFSLKIELDFGSKGCVCLKHCFKSIVDVISTFGGFCLDIADDSGWEPLLLVISEFGTLSGFNLC